jgi:hypothetical protein
VVEHLGIKRSLAVFNPNIQNHYLNGLGGVSSAILVY